MTDDVNETRDACDAAVQAPERRIAVVLEGGMVQAVVADHPSLLGIEVIIIDYDTEGTERPVPVPQPDGGTTYAIVRFEGVNRADIDLQAVADHVEATEEREVAEAEKGSFEVTLIATRTITELCKARVKAEDEEEARQAARQLLDSGKLGWRGREESDATVEFKKIERLAR